MHIPDEYLVFLADQYGLTSSESQFFFGHRPATELFFFPVTFGSPLRFIVAHAGRAYLFDPGLWFQRRRKPLAVCNFGDVKLYWTPGGAVVRFSATKRAVVSIDTANDLGRTLAG